MGARERSKGQRGERELAAILADQLGQIVQRELGQERDGGADIRIAMGDYGAQPLAIQVKRTERPRLYAYLEQAAQDAKQCDGVPVAAMRSNGKPWVVAMYVDDWIRLVREAS